MEKKLINGLLKGILMGMTILFSRVLINKVKSHGKIK